MTTIQTKSHVGSDGLLHLSLPVDVKDMDLDVTVIVHPSLRGETTFVTHEEWLQFIKATAGAWQGEPFERPDQGEFEKRDEWG